MSGLIQVFHDEIDATALITKASLPHYEERGWVRVEEVEPEMPSFGSPRNRSNDLELDEDGLESDEDASESQEE